MKGIHLLLQGANDGAKNCWVWQIMLNSMSAREHEIFSKGQFSTSAHGILGKGKGCGNNHT